MDIGQIVDSGDIDGSLRALEGLLARRDWAAVLDLRDRCRAALERGHQMWPVAEHAEYRLALEGPGPYAAAVVRPGAGRFAPGPLSEVVASTHDWAELRPHLPPSPAVGHVAHERVVRGEDLSSVALPEDDLELPLRLFAFEPRYPLAHYRPDGVSVESPPDPVGAWEEHEATPAPGLDDHRLAFLRSVVEAWIEESDGRARTAAARGGAGQALGALGLSGPVRLRPLTGREALAALAAAGASGGAHGRRRGAALGRLAAWFALSGLCDLDWPPSPTAMEEGLGGLRVFEWDDGTAGTGWVLRLVVGIGPDSLALDAVDPSPSTPSRF